MDLRSLIAKMDAIESKINEAPVAPPTVQSGYVPLEQMPPAEQAAFLAKQKASNAQQKAYDNAQVPATAANPYANDPKQAAIYAAMSPEDQAWATKGGGKPDLTDKYIAARAPNGFKPAAAPVAQAANPAAAPVAQAANPAPTPAAAPQTSMNTDDEAGTHAFDPTWGGTKATGGQTVAPNANATWDNNKQMAVPNAPAAPINRDSMTFNQAFADAGKKGEKQFTWRGKKYAVQMAASNSKKQAANPAEAPAKTPIQPSVGAKGIAASPTGFNQNQADTLNTLAAGGMGAESIEHGKLAKALIESFGYSTK
jgi:hypothetical protein